MGLLVLLQQLLQKLRKFQSIFQLVLALKSMPCLISKLAKAKILHVGVSICLMWIASIMPYVALMVVSMLATWLIVKCQKTHLR